MYFETNKFIDNSDKVQYNYYPTQFYKNQFQDRIEKSGFIKIPYSSKSNQPNIAVLGSGYVTKNLYITAPIHRVANVKYDAELIVEHLPLTNLTDPLYTCFLLKTSNSGSRTDIDKLIEGSTDVLLELNRYIPKQKAIVYKNNYLESSSVAVFTVPILVGSTFTNLKEVSTISLAPYVNEYSVLYTEPILGNVIEGFDGDSTTPTASGSSDVPSLGDLSGMMASETTAPSDKSKVVDTKEFSDNSTGPVTVAGYCQPIDETDPNISQTAGVIIPMDSNKIKNDAANSTIKTMLNFFGFFILVISAVFVTPIAHKILIVELIHDNEDFTAQRKLNRANAADVYTGALFFGFAIAFINYGILNNKPLATIIGFYVFVFFMASVIILQYQRIFDPATYLNQFTTKGVTPSFENVEMDWGFFSENIFNLFIKTTMEKNPDPATSNEKPLVPIYHFQLGFVGVIFINSAIYLLLKWFHFAGKGGSFFYTSIYFYTLLFAIYLMALIGHYRYKTSKMNQPGK
jgi:hypothetical protein